VEKVTVTFFALFYIHQANTKRNPKKVTVTFFDCVPAARTVS